jgi:hypothetical protein
MSATSIEQHAFKALEDGLQYMGGRQLVLGRRFSGVGQETTKSESICRHAAKGMDMRHRALGLNVSLSGERKATQEERCVLRSQSSVVVDQSRFHISIQHHKVQ